MLVALDRHLKQRDSKMPIAKDRELVKCKQEHFAKKATENDQMQQKHLPFKTRPKEMQNIKQWPVLSCHYWKYPKCGTVRHNARNMGARGEYLRSPQ